MKDKETILISHNKSISKLKIENNELKVEDYKKNVDIDSRGNIIDYKNDIAWTNKSFIFLNYNKKRLTVEYKEVGYDQQLNIQNIYEYNDEILLYLYLFIDSGSEYEAIHFNYFKNEKKNNKKDIIFESGESNRTEYEFMNTYKINNYRKNEIIIFCKTEINIINIINMQKIMKIKIKEELAIYNSYYFNNSYCLLFLYEGNEEKNNIMIFKIIDEFNEIILEKKLETGKYDELYYYSLNNNNNSQLISIDYNEVNFHEITFNVNKTYFSEKDNVNENSVNADSDSDNDNFSDSNSHSNIDIED